jgi:hypothetical protein
MASGLHAVRALVLPALSGLRDCDGAGGGAGATGATSKRYATLALHYCQSDVEVIPEHAAVDLLVRTPTMRDHLAKHDPSFGSGDVREFRGT